MGTRKTRPSGGPGASPLDVLYTYDELKDPDSFRIMTVMPGEYQDWIQVHLTTVRVSEEPHYQALSYVWGDPSKVERISIQGVDCSGFIFRTVNLCDALRAVRRTNDEVKIWADAICIDPNVLLERNHQVRQMATIYSSAASVFVWLGRDANGDGERALNVARHIALLEGYTEYEFEKVDALLNLMQREWFSRVWIIHEIGLARNATLLCGHSTADWDYLHSACKLIAETWKGSDAVTWNALSSRVSLLRHWTNPSDTFLSVLDSFGWYAATDLLDHVFALLSHGSATKIGNEDLIIQPDYRMSLADVYLQVANAIVEKEENLDIVLRQGPGKRGSSSACSVVGTTMAYAPQTPIDQGTTCQSQ